MNIYLKNQRLLNVETSSFTGCYTCVYYATVIYGYFGAFPLRQGDVFTLKFKERLHLKSGNWDKTQRITVNQ